MRRREYKLYLAFLDTEAEKEHFTLFYKTNYEKMCRTAMRILQNKEEAKQAVEESLVKLVKRYKQYQNLTALEMTKLCTTIVKYTSMDIILKRKCIGDREYAWITRISVESLPPKALLKQKGMWETQENVMNTLPLRMKKVLILKYYYQYNNKEIAKLLNISLKTVEIILFHGKIKLRKNFENRNRKMEFYVNSI